MVLVPSLSRVGYVCAFAIVTVQLGWGRRICWKTALEWASQIGRGVAKEVAATVAANWK